MIITTFYKNNLSLFFKLVVLSVISFILGVYIGKFFWQSSEKINGIIIREGIKSNYKLTNPLLFCGVSESKDFEEYKDLKNKLETYINTAVKDKKAYVISVYFRDLDNGRWTGVNENKDYSPASLLKVPTMIAFLKLAESHPEILSKKILYDGSFDDNKSEGIKPLKSLEVGQAYSIEDLITAMIVYSDNNATRLLHNEIDSSLLTEVYTDLGLHIPPYGGVDFMSTKSYSYFFRVLYNSTYLNRTMSEKALELLQRIDFPQGISAGIPANVTASQKFGEHTFINPITNMVDKKELHDCGIIYYMPSPYLLCIMTVGADFVDLTDVIRDISKLVYDDQSRTNWKNNR